MGATATLEEALRRILESRLEEFSTAFPATVISYDPTTQCADLEPVVRVAVPSADDQGVDVFLDMPTIPSVPIMFPRNASGTYAIAWPVEPGDAVLCVVADWDPSGWRVDGIPSDPGFVLTHFLGGCFAFPMEARLTQPLDALTAGAAAMVFEAPEFHIGKDAVMPSTFGTPNDANWATLQALLTSLAGAGTGDAAIALLAGSLPSFATTAATKVKIT